MKTKLEMAHDWMIKHDDGSVSVEVVVFRAWQYADLMQAEADKRNNKETCDKNIGLDSSVLKEWQPDWSQAPDGYDWFAVDKKGTAYFYTYKPETIESEEYWADFTGISSNGTALESDSSFGHTGDWRDSLRKRPQ